MSRVRDEEGVVLLLVLVLLVVTISTVYAMAKTSTLEVLSTRYRIDRVRADLLARSGPEIAMRALADDLIGADPLTKQVESAEDGWALLGLQPLQVPDGELRVRVQDLGSSVNLNALLDPNGDAVGTQSREFLKATLTQIVDTTPALLEEADYTDEKINDLVDAILDWIDKNDHTRLGTPEEEYYLAIEKADSGPVNRPIFSMDELAPIPGMGALLLEAMKSYFTTYPMFPAKGTGGINLNTAPPHVLGLLYHGTGLDNEMISQRQILEILRARKDGRVFCKSPGDERCVTPGQVLGMVDSGESFFPPLQYTSSVFRIDSEATIGETRSCVSTIVDRDKPYGGQTLYYRLGC